MPSQTGPITPEGKALAARNALKHGLTARTPVIPGVEDPDEWQRHLDGMMESLQPEGWHELVLAERIAVCLWRARRAVYAELAEIEARQAAAEEDLRIAGAYAQGTLSRGIYPEISEDALAAARARRLLPAEAALHRISRYEAHIQRQYLQTLHELEALQARRRGESTPLARLDVTGPPGS